MNNHRLLTGLTCIVLWGWSVCRAQTDTSAGKEQVFTISEIFYSAETSGIQLRASVTAEREAAKEISVSRSKMLPEITASLSLSYMGDGFTTKRNFSDYQKAPIPHFGNGLGVNIYQPLYMGGAIKAGVEMSEKKAVASEYYTELKRNDIRYRLTGYYLDIYKYRNLKEVVEKNINLAKRMLTDMKVRYDQGIVLQNDITRYELLVADFNLQLIKINNLLEILNRNLIITAGLPETVIVVPDSTMLSRSLPMYGEEWWQREAKVNSPMLKLSNTSVEISRVGEKLARSETLPHIGLQGAWTMDGPILVEIPPINRNLSYWYLGVGVSYNLSSLYKTNRSVEKSRLVTLRSEEQLAADTEMLQLEVNADYIKYMEAYEELKSRRKSVELAARNYTTVATRYEAGMALITDLLDAATSKLAAEQDLVNAGINIIFSYYKLLFTTGQI